MRNQKELTENGAMSLKSDQDNFDLYLLLKGTGTRDLIWLKVVSLDRSWLVGLRTTFKTF